MATTEVIGREATRITRRLRQKRSLQCGFDWGICIEMEKFYRNLRLSKPIVVNIVVQPCRKYLPTLSGEEILED